MRSLWASASAPEVELPGLLCSAVAVRVAVSRSRSRSEPCCPARAWLSLRHRPPPASHRADILLWGTHLEISGPQCVLGRYKTVSLSLGSVQANATSGLPLSLTLRFVPRGPTPTSLRPSHQPGTPVQYKVVGLLAPVRGGGCVFFKIKP